MSDEFSRYAQSRWTRLVHFGLLLGCEVHDAEDMAQSTLLKCFAQWDKVSAAMDTDAYVYKMLINEWRSRGRRRWVGEILSGHLPDRKTEQLDSESIQRVDLIVALKKLSDEHRAVLLLRFYADLSETDTARILRVPAGTVKSRSARALERLRELLSNTSATETKIGH